MEFHSDGPPLTPSHPATVMMDISIAICKHMASESSGVIVPVHEHALGYDCDHLIAPFYVE